MKERIQKLIKYYKFLYTLYYYFASAAISILKCFVKKDDKLILFTSFGGKKFDDSPKAIFDVMKNDSRFADHKLVWAFHSPQSFDVQGGAKIKTDTLEYFKTAIAAACWVTNSGIERGLKFKRKGTYYFNTWHGTPIKKLAADCDGENKSFSAKDLNNIDNVTAQSEFEADTLSRALGIDRDKYIMCGLPRNDRFAVYTDDERMAVRRKLGIKEGKTVILYAPTFREFERDDNYNCVLKPPMDLTKWQSELGEDYCLLFRAHYEVSKAMEITDNSFVMNMTEYPFLEDVMIAADILISDYSSIFFDFSIMDKAMLHFTYDYDKYVLNRGVYFDIREYLSGADNEDELIDHIKRMNIEKEIEKTVKFRNEFVKYSGSASKISVEHIYENIRGAE